jgi:hypothetical protein
MGSEETCSSAHVRYWVLGAVLHYYWVPCAVVLHSAQATLWQATCVCWPAPTTHLEPQTQVLSRHSRAAQERGRQLGKCMRHCTWCAPACRGRQPVPCSGWYTVAQLAQTGP